MYPEKPITDEFANIYADKTPPWGFGNLGYVVYKRTYARPILDENDRIVATEEWHQTLQRVINGAQAVGAGYTKDEAERLYDYMFNLKGSLAGRMLWQLGTPNNERLGGDSLVNCWMCDVAKVEDFGWIFERLMLGGGVGFSVDEPQRLGVVRQGRVENVEAPDADFIVPDKREGWSELLTRAIRTYLGGTDDPQAMTYSTQLVRPAGAPIKTFGGTASGPGILHEGIEKITAVLDGAVNRTLESVEVLDIVNIIGQIVVSGNVRRSAEIALGKAHDLDFLQAKRWDLYDVPAWRAMSNNTIYLEPEQIPHLPDEFWEGYLGNGEPYGMFNLSASQKYGRMGEERPDYTIVGTNPCVTADTWVMTGEGARQVVDLIDRPFSALVDGKPYQATGFWKTGEKEVLKLITTDGYKIRLTSDHKVLTPEGWVEAGNLNGGDEVIIHDHFGNLGWGGAGTEDDGYVVGHLIGDGTFSTNNNGVESAHLAVWATDEGSWGPKRRLTRIVMEDMPHRSDLKGWRASGGTDQYRLTSAAVRDLAASFGIRHGNKAVGKEIEEASSAFYRGFLRALFDTDGHVEGKSTEGGISVRLSSTDYATLEAVQRMLARLGIRSRIRSMHESGFREMPGGTYFTQKSYRLIISGNQTERFMSEVGFENAAKTGKWVAEAAGMKRGFYEKASTAIVWGLIPDGKEAVYDCTVDSVHAFDANGIYVHNCAEIGLAHRESCNLSEIFLPNVTSEGELEDLAQLLYKTQKAVAAMPYLDRVSSNITSRNMRLGLGITGVAQAIDKLDWLSPAYEALRLFDAEWSAIRRWPESVRLTTVKPSGTLSLLAGVTPGVHPGFARYHIRRVRMAYDDPLVNYCRSQGYFVEHVRNFDGTEDNRTVIVEFPCEFPEGTMIADDMTAIELLDLTRRLQRDWADNAVSATIYFSPDELQGIKEYLAEHWHQMKSVSFLLQNDHGFEQAPLQAITQDDYKAMLSKVSTHHHGYQIEGMSTLLDGESCATGSCPVR